MKLNDYQRGRLEGMTYIGTQLQKGVTVEEILKEIRFRCGSGITTPISSKDLDKVSVAIKEMTFDTVLALSIAVLYEEFGFGPVRLERYIDGFSDGFQAMVADGSMIKWFDIINNIKYSTGIELQVRWNDDSGTVLKPLDQEDMEGSYQWKKAHRKKPVKVVCGIGD